MIALLRSTDGNPDSRYEKYIDFLEDKGVQYLSLCWDRNSNKTDDEKHKYYHVPAKFGDGLANVKKLLGFNKFLFKELRKDRQNYKVIHAADFDTIIPAILMHIFYGKKVIYDVYDWYIDSRCIHNFILKNVVKLFEYFNIKLSEKVIICEPERERQICFKPKSLWILPNIPNYPDELPELEPNNKITVSYVGILGYERGLEKLIQYCKEHYEVELRIAGFGPLSSMLDDVAKYTNIKYYGSVAYKEALKIMNKSDLVYAVYETSNPNHVLAAPNKYYEGLYLGKPIITTKGTIVGDKTIKYDTGYAIGEDIDDLDRLFKTIEVEDVAKKGNNARDLWRNKYVTYVKDFLNNTYLPFIEQANR